MTRITTTAGETADDRRKTDRRKRSVAFDGQERRVAQRRTLRERRAQHD